MYPSIIYFWSPSMKNHHNQMAIELLRTSDTKITEPLLKVTELCLSGGISEEDILSAIAGGWDDREDDYTYKIKAARPCNTNEYGKHALAIDLVNNRKSKGELVDLVNWLLQKIDITTL